MGILTPPSRPQDTWTATRWSVLGRLGDTEGPSWEGAWDYLVQTYRSPMERYAQRVLSRLRGRPASREEAEDVVESFLASCFEKDWLTRADPARGRFRAFVHSLLRRFVHRHVRHEAALKRQPGNGKAVLSMRDDEDLAIDPSGAGGDLEEFDRTWVQVAVDRALQRLGEEHDRYQIVILDLITTHGEGSEDLPQQVGLRRAQVPVLRHRARKRFQKLFEEELALTVGDEEAFAEEWRALLPYIASYGD